MTYQNAYTSVANYEGTITDEQYEAALAEIQAIKDAIASKGVDVVRQDETLMNELIAHVISAAEAVGIKVVYEGNGRGKVIFDNSTGNTGTGAEDGANGLEGTASKPIKQTGLDYTPTFILGAGMGSAGGSVFGLLIGLAALVASMWFSLAQGVKRLHDLDKSGWLILLMFVPIVNALFGLYMLFADGTVGPNQYGEDPKNRMPYQAQPSSVNVTVNVAREEVKVEKPVEAAPAVEEEKAE